MVDALFEPRAFWEVATVDVTTSDTSEQTVVLNPNSFYNGERYPIEIKHIVVSMINYARKTFSDPGGLPGPASGYDALSNILANFRLVISARQRQSYSRYPVDASMFVNTPSDLLVPYYGDSSKQFSSFYGTIFRKFDPHLRIPKDGTLQFDLTAFDGTGPGPGQTNNTTSAMLAFHELGTLFGGNARVFTFDLRAAAVSSAAPYGAVISPQALAPAVNGPNTNQLWPPQHSVNPRLWKAQSPAAQGSAEFTGLSVLIDQIDYDDFNIANLTTPTPLAMLATRIGCRARLTDGGSKAWWWRPGAPLPLVFPDITPALVLKLDKPITMGPGEQLEIELTVPAVGHASLTGYADEPIPTTYEFGIALNGYASIEG